MESKMKEKKESIVEVFVMTHHIVLNVLMSMSFRVQQEQELVVLEQHLEIHGQKLRL